MSNIDDLLRLGTDILSKAAVDNSEYDARILLEAVLKVDRSYIIINKDQEVNKAVEAAYMTFIKERASRYPLQYILGYVEFYGYNFLVKEGVLIPRQDTEIIVEEVIAHTNTEDRVLDMCTGSGCIGITIAKETGVKVDLVDISDAAIEVATDNNKALAANCHIIKSDLFDDINGIYDIIVSNPPYIRSEVIPTLMEEVKDYEPILALDGYEDGLYFYRRIIEESTMHLTADGYIFFEIGCDQGEEVKDILKNAEYIDITVVKDLAGLDRLIYAHR